MTIDKFTKKLKHFYPEFYYSIEYPLHKNVRNLISKNVDPSLNKYYDITAPDNILQWDMVYFSAVYVFIKNNRERMILEML